MEAYAKPLPEVDEDTRPYWEGCKQQKLLFQECASCGTVQSYPRKVCMRCMQASLVWRESSGRGDVYSFSVVHRGPQGFEDDVPYVVAIVQLAEGFRVMTNIVDCDPDSVRIGLDVQVVFQRINEDVTLPKFTPARR